MDVSRGELSVIPAVSYILSVEIDMIIELELNNSQYNTTYQSAESALPYVVIHTGGEDSVPCPGGEISTGNA